MVSACREELGDEGLERSPETPGETAIVPGSGAISGALVIDLAILADPELARIVDAWPRLPADVRMKVLVIAEGAPEGQ